MTARSAQLGFDPVEIAMQLGGLLLRTTAYATFAAFADRYDCGRAVLTGLFAGDLVATGVGVLWQWRDSLLRIAGEVVVIALLWCWVQHQLVWPTDLVHRAALGLAGFAAFTVRIGANAMTRFGQDDGFH